MRLTPASRHMSTWRVPPSTSVLPTLANFSRPPKVMVPRVRADTRSPECPSWRYSIARSLRQRGARHGPAVLEQQPLELARGHLAREHVDAVAVLERHDVAREPARLAGELEVAGRGALLEDPRVHLDLARDVARHQVRARGRAERDRLELVEQPDLRVLGTGGDAEPQRGRELAGGLAQTRDGGLALDAEALDGALVGGEEQLVEPVVVVEDVARGHARGLGDVAQAHARDALACHGVARGRHELEPAAGLVLGARHGCARYLTARVRREYFLN